MRLIDADAYAAEMKKRQDACMEAMENASYEGEQFSPKEHWEGVLAAFAEAKLTLDDMPTIGGWINVKDRLPEQKWTDYLVATRIQNDGTRGYNIAWLNDDNGVWKSNDEWICDGREIVTHWRPLPELPEEGEA